MDVLEILSKNHTDWVRMVRSMKNPVTIGEMSIESASDIVHDMYVKLYNFEDSDRFMLTKTEINKHYIFIILRNLYYDIYRENKRMVTNSVESYIGELGYGYNDDNDDVFIYNKNNLYQYTDDNINHNEELDRYTNEEKLRANIQDEINSWHHYESDLFKYVHYENINMRQLSRGTGIEYFSIYNTIRGCRDKLRTKFGEDYNNIKQ